MSEEILIKRNATIGWTVSLVLHLVLGLLFIVIIIDTSLNELDFAEVSFSSVVSVESEQPVERPSVTTPQAPASQASVEQEKHVNLPKRRMLEDDPPTLPEDSRDRADINQTVSQSGQSNQPVAGRATESQVKPGVTIPGENDPRGSRRIDVGQKATTELPTAGIGGSVMSNKAYEIAWEGGDREILSDPLPSFPEGINREAVLRMRITVLPNGTMGEVIPLQKGDATLETVTIRTLKQWLFNELDASSPQIAQNGVITFRFVLK